MANHVRQQIREAIGVVLTGLTTSGARVYQSRIYPLADANLPGLLIHTETESVAALEGGPRGVQQRTLDVLIKAVAKSVSDLDDTLDTLCKEVEIALNLDRFLGGLCCAGLTLVHTDIQLNGEHEKPVGVATMTWRASYHVTANAPDVAR